VLTDCKRQAEEKLDVSTGEHRGGSFISLVYLTIE
jgi:hypothetical protein